MIQLTDKEFEQIYKMVREQYGINLEKKRNLIQSRLQSTLNNKGLDNFSDYFKLLVANKDDELTNFLNNITTNHTFFFREKDHFDLLSKTILPEITGDNKHTNFNIWSAGCSSGEEVFSIVMTIIQYLGFRAPMWNGKLLASDISRKVMAKAQNGVYTDEHLRGIPSEYVRRFFKPNLADKTYTLKEEVLKHVNFQYLNLMSQFPYTNKFDVIFCRNVMIYFDNETRTKLVAKFHKALKPGGYFIIGHSETLNAIKNDFTYIKPSVYRKEK